MWKQEFVDAKERFAEAFMLPKDLVMNATLFHMIGERDIYLENYKGILQYTDSEILLQSLRGKVLLRGRNLEIVWYTSLEMKITGAISSILLQQK